MRLQIEQGDDAAFSAAREWLLELEELAVEIDVCEIDPIRRVAVVR